MAPPLSALSPVAPPLSALGPVAPPLSALWPLPYLLQLLPGHVPHRHLGPVLVQQGGVAGLGPVPAAPAVVHPETHNQNHLEPGTLRTRNP